MTAAKYGNTDAVVELVKGGADIHMQNKVYSYVVSFYTQHVKNIPDQIFWIFQQLPVHGLNGIQIIELSSYLALNENTEHSTMLTIL